jgi:transposase
MADDLGLGLETLRGWVRAGGRRRGGPVVSAGGAAPTSVKNAELRELEEERGILRKAAQYFTRETRW